MYKRQALKKGIVNLEKHIENLQKFGVPVVVTLNAFVSDTEAETAYVEPVSYTHLDVYKRQLLSGKRFGSWNWKDWDISFQTRERL